MASQNLRSRYSKEFNLTTEFMGYTVTASGVVYNSKGKLIKPKFMFKGKRIDYVYIDITYKGVKRRISYHRFIYMAWNKDFVDDPNVVVTTNRSRFHYNIGNLICISREEHIRNLAERAKLHTDDEIADIVETYEAVKDYMTIQQLANRLGISRATLVQYLRKER